MVRDTLIGFHCHQNYIQMSTFCQGTWLGGANNLWGQNYCYASKGKKNHPNDIEIRVDTCIIEWYPIIEHFQVFPHFIIELKVFYVIGSAKKRTTNVLWTSKAKEQSKKRTKRKSDILFQILPLNLYLIHFSFISHNFKGYKCTISRPIKLV
jgi:hypothetical protein